MESIEQSNPKISCHGIYILLFIPVTLFVISFVIPPQTNFDAAMGFIALRNMLEGGSFNNIPTPDAKNIANDVEIFSDLVEPRTVPCAGSVRLVWS